jgi:hypothetical protein
MAITTKSVPDLGGSYRRSLLYGDLTLTEPFANRPSALSLYLPHSAAIPSLPLSAKASIRSPRFPSTNTLINMHVNNATSAHHMCVTFMVSIDKVTKFLHKAIKSTRCFFLGRITTSQRHEACNELKDLAKTLGRIKAQVQRVNNSFDRLDQEDRWSDLKEGEHVWKLCQEGFNSLKAKADQCDEQWRAAWKLWEDIAVHEW